MPVRLWLAILLSLGLLAGCGSSSSSAPHKGGGTTRAAAPQANAPGAAPAFHPLAVPSHPPARSVDVPILTYHRVHQFATELTKSIPDLTVEPSTFAAEMAALDQAGYRTITQRQLFDAMYHGAALPRKRVLLTVDDGYVDDVTQILPVLKRHHMVATFYVITQRTHEPGFLTGAQIRKLARAGMDIGAHTRTHPSLTALGAAALRDEVEGSQQDLRRLLGHPVYWFAYPYGVFNSSVIAQVERAGFLLATTTQTGTQASTRAPFTIPRLHVGRTATAATVLGLVQHRVSSSAPPGSG